MFDFETLLEYLPRANESWLAGIFDGEGCVSSLIKDDGKISLNVSITQKDPVALALIMLKFPGTIDDIKIRWDGRSAIPVLEYIKDYVIFKHEVVLLGLELANRYSDLRQGAKKVLSEEEKNFRLDLQKKIKVINQGGLKYV